MGEITQRYAPSVLQAELLKAIAQRVPGDAEALSGLGLVSGRLAHRSLDHRLFPMSEVDALGRQCGRASAHLRRRRAMVGARQREMLHVQRRTAAPQHRALDHVAELADVAGPRIRQQQLARAVRSEEHTSELQSQSNLVCRLLLEKKKKKRYYKSVSSIRS